MCTGLFDHSKTVSDLTAAELSKSVAKLSISETIEAEAVSWFIM